MMKKKRSIFSHGVPLIIFCWLLVFIGTAAAQYKTMQDAKPEIVTGDYQFTEGPYWHSDGYLLFSDIPANTIYQWKPGMKKAKVFLKPSGHSNGITADNNGNLIIAQHDGKISRLMPDKTMKTIAASYQGKRLNSPNDVAVRSDGSIYFTDPPYGVSKEDRELDFSGVYRIKPDGTVVLLYKEFSRPNGIVFSPDERTLYINDSATGRILAFDVKTDGSLGQPNIFAEVGEPQKGAADGMTVDKQGNLYSTGPGGALYIFDKKGTLLNKISFGEQITNAGWGGPENKTLFVTGADNVYRLK